MGENVRGLEFKLPLEAFVTWVVGDREPLPSPKPSE